VAAGLACGVVLVAAMVVVELRKESPMIDVRLLTNRLFASGSTVMTVHSVAFLGTLFTITLYFQDERGMTPLASGLSTFPEAMGVVIGSQLASRLLYRRLRPRRHLMLGTPTCGWSGCCSSAWGSPSARCSWAPSPRPSPWSPRPPPAAPQPCSTSAAGSAAPSESRWRRPSS
jgi:hypothetical protein